MCTCRGLMRERIVNTGTVNKCGGSNGQNRKYPLKKKLRCFSKVQRSTVKSAMT